MKAEILKREWFSGQDTVGVVLVKSSDGKKRAYIGVASRGTEEEDAERIADFGARLPYSIAVAVFPGLDVKEYSEEGV